MATQAEFDSLEFFRASDFQHPESMSGPLLVLLDSARAVAGVPFEIISDVRPGSAEHVLGMAVDIRCHDPVTRFAILRAVFAVGFRRVGVYDRHIHVGLAEALPQRLCWLGVSLSPGGNCAS